jgi:hypothetical protein
MNPHQKPQEDVVVTQEDREAAAAVASRTMKAFVADGFNERLPLRIREGVWDEHWLVEAFARHRLLGHEAGRRDMREAAARMCAQVSGLIGASAGSSIHSALREAENEIRALPTEPLGGDEP